MSLRYNTKTGDFVIVSTDEKKAQEVGLDRSTIARGPKGEPVWFTKDAYAALSYWDEADAIARERLEPMQRDYVASWAQDGPTDFKRPQGLDYIAFQRAGISYGIDKGRVLIGDEPGLGKTIQAIGIANAIGSERNIVICPASIRLNWTRQIMKWSTIPNCTVSTLLKGGAGPDPRSNYVVLSYELARNIGINNALVAGRYTNLIIDEAHYLKTIDAKRTQAIFGGGKDHKESFVSKDTPSIIALTGTPLPNRPRECYTLARALNWEAIDWASYDDFCYRFNPSRRMVSDEGAIWNEEKRGRLPELQARLRTNFMIRRLKKDVQSQLPDKRYEFGYLEDDGRFSDILAREALIKFHIQDLKNPWFDITDQISTVRRQMGEAKIPSIIEHLKMLLDIEEIPKVVAFCHHRSVMDAINEALKDYGVVMVRGGIGPKRQQYAIDQFVNSPAIRIFLGQLDAAGFGIDGLQGVCSRAVIAEPAWTPGTNEQAIDRLHRIGQHENVIATFLVVEGSLDEYVLASVLDKAHTIHTSLDRSLVGDITADLAAFDLRETQRLVEGL